MKDFQKRIHLERQVHEYLLTGLATDEIAKILGMPNLDIYDIKETLERNTVNKAEYEEARSKRIYEKRHPEYVAKKEKESRKFFNRKIIADGIRNGLTKNEIMEQVRGLKGSEFLYEYDYVKDNVIEGEEWIDIHERRQKHLLELKEEKKRKAEEEKKKQEPIEEKQEVSAEEDKPKDENEALERIRRLAKKEYNRELTTGDTDVPIRKRITYRDEIVRRFEKRNLDSKLIDYDVLIETMVVHNEFINSDLLKMLILNKYREEGIKKAKHLSQQLAGELKKTKYGPKLLQYSSQLEKYIDPVQDRLL